MRQELLEKALFSVKITSGEVNIDEKDLTYDKAIKLFWDTVDKNKNNEFIVNNHVDVFNSFGFIGIGNGGNNFAVSAYLERSKVNEPHLCPRRVEGIPIVVKSLAGDCDFQYKVNDERTCSYCGSLHPEDVITLLEKEGQGVFEMSDKGYKIYINRPDVPNASFGAIKFYTMHFTPEQIDRFNNIMANLYKKDPKTNN